MAARTSTFSFKGKDATVSGIARALNVNSVLEGSVRKSGNRLRITVQLVNAEDGYHLWSERYDRELKDIFDVQDEIALAVVDALKVRLLGREKAAVLKRYTENVEAYQLYLKGRYYWWKTKPEDFHKSRDFFQRAVETDPTYALGYCGLSSYYGFGVAWGMLPPGENWPRAMAANTMAMELDNTLAEVHNDLAGISMVYDRDWAATEREARRAVELNPKFQEIHYLYSFYLAVAATASTKPSLRAEQALDLTRSRYASFITSANATISRGATTRPSASINRHSNWTRTMRRCTSLLVRLSNRRGCITRRSPPGKRRSGFPAITKAPPFLAAVIAKDGFDKAVRAAAERDSNNWVTQLSAVTSSRRSISPVSIRGSGRTDQAFEWLEKACDERNVFPLLIHADPFYDRLKPNSRLAELLRRFSLGDNDESSVVPTPGAVANLAARVSFNLARGLSTKATDSQALTNPAKTNKRSAT